MKFINLWENYKEKTELTNINDIDKTVIQNIIDSVDENNIEYRGNEFWESLYLDKIVDFSYNELNIGENISFEDDDILEDKISGQEAYLGYLPDQDIFISGWDMFSDSENLVFLKFDEDLNPYKVRGTVIGFGTFYDRTYEKLHEKYPTLIDIRLD